MLSHPSDPNLYKVGVTVRDPAIRIRQHNRDFKTAAGKIVLETGQEWHVKTIIEVVDIYWAEKVFWGATPLADIPFRGGVEVERLEWKYIEKALAAAKSAGIRKLNVRAEKVKKDRAWLEQRLKGSEIFLAGKYSGLQRQSEFSCLHGHTFLASAGVVANAPTCPLCH